MEIEGSLDLLFRRESLYLMIGTWIILGGLGQVLPQAFVHHHVMVRLAPIFPLVMCGAGVFAPGLGFEALKPVPRILVGLILGQSSGHFYKWYKQTVRGKDPRIEMRQAALGSSQPASQGDPPHSDPPGPREAA